MHKGFRWTAIAAALTVGVGSTAAVAAEGGVPEALARIDGTLNALLATLHQASTSLNQLVAAQSSAGPSVLITPHFAVQPNQNVSCNVLNSGTNTVSVDYAMKSGTPGSPNLTLPLTLTLQPGESLATFYTAPSPGGGVPAYCKFVTTVPAQIRTQIVVYAPGGLIATAAADGR